MIKTIKKFLRLSSSTSEQIRLVPWLRIIYSIVLIGFILAACYINFQSSDKIGFYVGLWGFVGLICALTSGLLWRQHKYLSIIPLSLAIFCEVSVHTEYLLQEADFRRQSEEIIKEKRNRFLKQGLTNTAKLWPERARSVGEIKAEISARLNKRIARYKKTVRHVTKNCSTNYSRTSAWIECNRTLELKQELARAVEMAGTDKKADDAYTRLDALKIIPRSNRFIAKLSQWLGASETDLEVGQVAGRVIGLQIIIMIMTHLTFAPVVNYRTKGKKIRRSKWNRKTWRFRKQSASNVLRFERKTSVKRHIEKFLADFTVRKRGSCIGSTVLYNEFVRYQKARNLPTYSQHLFGAVLRDIGLKKGPDGPDRLIHYYGLELLSEQTQERNLLRKLW